MNPSARSHPGQRTRLGMNALPAVPPLWRRAAALGTVLVTALALGVGQARAVVLDAGPVWPIPADAPPGPPPVPALPAAGAAPPPASEIADPVTPAAVCGDWYLQGDYGDRWPGASTWWEYGCTAEHAEYYPHPCQGTMCEQACYGYPFDCFWFTERKTDLFYWDGSHAVFYGQFYASWFEDDSGYHDASVHWWDEPTARWYRVGGDPPTVTNVLTISEAGAGSGQVSSSPAGIDCGSTCEARFDTTAQVTLSATADASSDLTGWSGDCSGTGTCQVSMDQARFVTATFAPKPLPNIAPTARLTASCTGLTCTLDGASSSDSDGTIQTDRWDFGDGTAAVGKTVTHSYAQAGSYTVKLTVTDDDGATGTASKAITLIGLTAHGYKLKGLQKVDLSWNGSTGANFDVYRDGQKIAKAAGSSYTDNLNRNGAGSYSYKVCQAGGSICSNQVAITF